MKKFIEPTPEQRRQLLNEYGVTYDSIVREKERRDITSLCRSSAWEMEQSGNYPRRRRVGRGGVGWLLSDLLHWIYQQ